MESDIDSAEESAGGDGGSSDGIHVATVLADGQFLLAGVLTDDVALLALLEPEAGFGTEARGLSMFENGVALDGTLFGETNQDLQCAAEAIGINSLNSHALVCRIKDDIVAIGVLHGLGVLHLSVCNAKHRVDAFSESASLILFDGARGNLIHVGQCSTGDDRDKGQHQEHIR